MGRQPQQLRRYGTAKSAHRRHYGAHKHKHTRTHAQAPEPAATHANRHRHGREQREDTMTQHSSSPTCRKSAYLVASPRSSFQQFVGSGLAPPRLRAARIALRLMRFLNLGKRLCEVDVPPRHQQTSGAPGKSQCTELESVSLCNKQRKVSDCDDHTRHCLEKR